MSAEALKWFEKEGGRHAPTPALYVVLHLLCLQDPKTNPGAWFKPNLSDVRRRSPVTRQTASEGLATLSAAGLIEHRPAGERRVKGSIRIRLEETFEEVIEEAANCDQRLQIDGPGEEPNCRQRRQRGVGRDDTQLSAETTETVGRADTTHIQIQGSGGATPKPEPDPCITGGTDSQPKGRKIEAALNPELLSMWAKKIIEGQQWGLDHIKESQKEEMLRLGMVTAEQLKAVRL